MIIIIIYTIGKFELNRDCGTTVHTNPILLISYPPPTTPTTTTLSSHCFFVVAAPSQSFTFLSFFFTFKKLSRTPLIFQRKERKRVVLLLQISPGTRRRGVLLIRTERSWRRAPRGFPWRWRPWPPTCSRSCSRAGPSTGARRRTSRRTGSGILSGQRASGSCGSG